MKKSPSKVAYFSCVEEFFSTFFGYSSTSLCEVAIWFLRSFKIPSEFLEQTALAILILPTIDNFRIKCPSIQLIGSKLELFMDHLKVQQP